MYKCLVHLAALYDCDGELGAALRGGHCLDHADYGHALDYPTKDDMLVIEPLARGAGDEELAAVGVRAAVGHGQQARGGVVLGKVLIIKLVAVDAGASGSITTDYISPLDHKILDDSVEGGPFVTHRVALSPKLASAELPKVLSGPWGDICKELHLDAACWVVPYSHVHEDHRVIHRD